MSPILLSVAFAVTPYVPPTDCNPGWRGPRPAGLPDQLESSLYPIVIHFDAAASADETTRAQAILDALEVSWDVQVDQLGFQPPVIPDAEGGPEFDVYLFEYFWGSAFVAADGWDDAVVGDGLNSASSYMVIDNRLPTAWVNSYVAHEFNHACQWATDFTELTLPIWEGTANAAAGWTFGADAGWDINVGSWQEASDWPALVGQGAYTWYGGGVGYYFEYGSALFVVFLDEKYGAGDGMKGAELWANAANEGFTQEPDAVDAFAATAGTTVGDALNHLAVVRFLTGDDWDDRGLIDAEDWAPDMAVPAAPIDGSTLPLLGQPLPVQPYVTGQVFVDIDLSTLPASTGTGEPWLDVSLSSPTLLEAGLAVMWWDDADQVGDESAWGVDPTVSIPSEGLTRVVVAATNLGPTGWDGDDDPYARADFLLSVETRLEGPTTTPGETGETGDTGTVPTGGTDTGTDTPTTDTGTEEPTEGSTGGDAGEEESGGCGCVQGRTAPWASPFTRRR